LFKKELIFIFHLFQLY